MSYKIKKSVKYIDVDTNNEIVNRRTKITNPNYYVERKEEIFKMIDEMKNEMYDNL